MDQQSKDKADSLNSKQDFKIRFGLRPALMTSFLLLAVIPVLIVSLLSYQTAYRGLVNMREQTLASATKSKIEVIENYFSRIQKDLTLQAETPSTRTLLNQLIDAYRNSGKSVTQFVYSPKWDSIVDLKAIDLEKFKRSYDYYDILLFDVLGNVLYSVERDNVLATNIFNGKYADSIMGDIVKNSLDSTHLSFSDFTHNIPSRDNGAYGFMTAAVTDSYDEVIGVIGFQFSLNQIDKIMQVQTRLGDRSEIYLIGSDLKMRSNSILVKNNTALKKTINTEQSRIWRDQLDREESISNMNHLASVYSGPHNELVFGIHHDIHVLGVNYAVIAEIESKNSFSSASRLRNLVSILLLLTIIIGITISIVLSRRIVRPILALSSSARKVADGHLEHEINISAKNEIGLLADSFNDMLVNLRNSQLENNSQNWLKTAQAFLNEKMRGEPEMGLLASNIISALSEQMGSKIGALYMIDEDEGEDTFRLIGTYAFSRRKNLSNIIQAGDGIVGQAAIEKKPIILTQCPPDYISISSALGDSPPGNIIVFPLLFEDCVIGIVELGSFQPYDDLHLSFLNQVAESIAIALKSMKSRNKARNLLKKTQQQAEELRVREEELKQTNEEMETHTIALSESQQKLQVQQEELRQANEELEEQREVEGRKNLELIRTKKLLEEKAGDLELSSKYKSEFLANMSHELRTPLNSILLLSRLMAEDKDNRFNLDDVESLNAINSSGKDLLKLINEVLDLSKVEAGKMELNLEDINLLNLGDNLRRQFNPQAMEKGLELEFELEENLPSNIYSDRQRIDQILKNFISNALKFTSKGVVNFKISRPEKWHLKQLQVNVTYLNPDSAITFSITDSGVGIQDEKQKMIFEAFQQADGSTSRKYGGTGLGLSISRELAVLLGGGILLRSIADTGSTFTLILPERYIENLSEQKIQKTFPSKAPVVKEPHQVTEEQNTSSITALSPITNKQVDDDRKHVTPDDRSILIIEDDRNFLKILRNLTHENGFKCLVVEDGETGLQFADLYQPSAIILDIGLPGIDGWTVMTRLKDNPKTRHIPVHFISGYDSKMEALKLGAIDFLTKPVSPHLLENMFVKIEKTIAKPIKDLLIVEDNINQQKAIQKLLGEGDIKISTATTGDEAYKKILTGNIDAVILDIGLPDMSGDDLLKKIRSNEEISRIPIIIYTGKELSGEKRSLLDKYAESTILKTADSEQKLLDETTLFLHRVESELPEQQQRMLQMMHDKEAVFHDKKILLVDDDMRNVFSLKRILEDKGMQIVVGKNGKEGLERLKEHPDTNLVLMDIMMPEMNGYEAMKEIRKQSEFKDLSIIALTAKAMKGDRNKCIEAGASDYLPKPVNVDRLFSMLRVWLYT